MKLLVIDALHHTVTIEGRTKHLTTTETKLLHLLAINVNTVCTQSQIVSHIWGFGDEGDAGLIKSHIRHLRKKIEPDPSNPRYIRTVAGVGYSLTHPPMNEEASQRITGIALHMEKVNVAR